MHNLFHRAINLFRKPVLAGNGWMYGKKAILNIKGVTIYWDGVFITFRSCMQIDADGSPHAYNPTNTGLDDNRNAKDQNGNWVGVVTNSNGRPVIQKSTDPAPGYYVSPTSYRRRGYAEQDPKKYIDAETIPYIVLSPLIINAVAATFIGCESWVTNSSNGVTPVYSLMAEVGPRYKTGEAGMKCAAMNKVNNNPRTGGTDDKIIDYKVKPGFAANINGEQFELQHYGARLNSRLKRMKKLYR